MKFYLNEVEVKVLNGATFSIQKDETLDSGKIELVFMEDKTPIKPMTDLTIIDDETYNFVVLSDTVEIASKNPECYKHTLQFVQNTKKFSKIQVRNTQFAQPAKNSLKCGCNATFQNAKNESSQTYMNNFQSDYQYSYSMEVSQRHKVKGAYIKVNTKWIKYSSENLYDSYYDLQDACPKLRIYFDVYKDDAFQYQQSAEYSDGDICYLLSLSNGVYTIKNIKVALLSDTSKYSANDLFVVNISLVADVYYYSLFDVLDTLRKQIALEEIDAYIHIKKPIIEWEKQENDYTYQVTITQQNANLGVLYYRYKFLEDTWMEWDTSINKTKTFILENSTKEEKIAYVEAYTQINNIKSEVETSSQVIAKGIEVKEPKIIVSDYEIWDKQVSIITNATQSDAVTYYRYYKNAVLAQNWTVYAGAFVFNADYEKVDNYKVQAKTYSAEAKLTSSWAVSEFNVDGAKKYNLSAPIISYRTEYNSSSDGYNVYITFTNYNKVACKCFYSATGSIVKSETTIGQLSENGGSQEILLGTIINSYDEGVVTAYLTYDKNTSPSNSLNWDYSGGITYELTKKYIGVGLSKTYIENISRGTLVKPSDYILDISGYKYSSCEPSTEFYMKEATAIIYNYVVGGKLDNPIISQYSTNSDSVTMSVYNGNNDVVTFYYVINPDEIPTSEEDIYSAVDHYTMASMSTGSQTESLVWGGDLKMTVYGAFVSTSHGTTYDPSGVASKTFYKLASPIISTSTSSSGYTLSIYNSNSAGAYAYCNGMNLGFISAKETITKTYSWSSSKITLTCQLISTNDYADSDTTSKTIEKPITKYTLTVIYYKDGVKYSSSTSTFEEGTKITISNYEISITDYKFDSSSPSSDFYMTSNKTLSMYYIKKAATHDYYFYNTVVWDSSFTTKSASSTLKLTLKSSKMTSDYSSSATYSVYDETLGVYLDDETRSVYVESSSGSLSGDTTHNNAKSIIADRGSN